jgi:phage terminase large subunit
MPLPIPFDFRAPDYIAVWQWRVDVLQTIRENPGVLDAFKEYYRAYPWEFISHWGSTFDPRNADIGLPTTVPFILFDKQIDFCKEVIRCWKDRANLICDKSRDIGASWLAVSLACTICIFEDGISIGFGSRKEEYVDKIGDPKTLFWKARMFMDSLPQDFRGCWTSKNNAPHMRLMFPETNCTIIGESGDGIGRGDRKSIYFVDESAYLERPLLIDASLSNTTNCRIDISSANGMANPFAQRRHSGKTRVFTMHWRDDPRKAEDHKVYKIDGRSDLVNWYEWIANKLDNPVVMAQEVDINYSASVEGVVIPSAWVQAAIGACAKLGIQPTGKTFGALDVADEGVDKNAMSIRLGVEMFSVDEWSGQNSDTFKTTIKAFDLADTHNVDEWCYDADGIGAFVRGDSNKINEERKAADRKQQAITAFRGSGAVLRPESQMVAGRKNKDYFKNFKAQSWWNLRAKFQTTFRAVIEGFKDYEPEDIISISPNIKNLNKLVMELSQPTYSLDTTGKIVIDKKPDGVASPNLADSVMMLYAPKRGGLFN